MVKANEQIQLKVSTRTETGSGGVNRLRRDGWLPAVMYDAKGVSRPLQLNRHNFEMLVRRHGGGQNLIIEMQTDDGDVRKVLLKEVQHDPIRDTMLHVDFMEISMTRKLRVDVVIHLTGEPSGVSQQGGVLEHLLRTVEIECLPADMIQELTLDVSGLEVGHSLFVRDLPVSPEITILTPVGIAVAAVHMPRVDEEKAPTEETAETAAEDAEKKPEATAAEGAEKKEAKEKK
ncbi:MAG: 50S ribosomal protein L25 [Kiritimatiellia bacterium]